MNWRAAPQRGRSRPRGNDLDDVPAPKLARDEELDNTEEVEKLLTRLSGRDREVVRLRHLEGRSYEEISTILDIPVNTIGPILARARTRMRKPAKDKASRDVPSSPTKDD